VRHNVILQYTSPETFAESDISSILNKYNMSLNYWLHEHTKNSTTKEGRYYTGLKKFVWIYNATFPNCMPFIPFNNGDSTGTTKITVSNFINKYKTSMI